MSSPQILATGASSCQERIESSNSQTQSQTSCKVDRKKRVYYPQEAAFNHRSWYFSTKSARHWSFMTDLQKQTKHHPHTPPPLYSLLNHIFVYFLLTSSLPVFLTEPSTVSLSQGNRVLRSISSQEIPSCKFRLHHGEHKMIIRFLRHNQIWNNAIYGRNHCSSLSTTTSVLLLILYSHPQ